MLNLPHLKHCVPPCAQHTNVPRKGKPDSAEAPTDWEGLPSVDEPSEQSQELCAEESLARSQLNPLPPAWWPQDQFQHLPFPTQLTTARSSEPWPRHWMVLNPLSTCMLMPTLARVKRSHCSPLYILSPQCF